MLVMSKGALSAGQAATYYEEKYSRDDYYTEQQRVAERWFGKVAAELGLNWRNRNGRFPRRAHRSGSKDGRDSGLRRATLGRAPRRLGRHLQCAEIGERIGVRR
jgi:TrwC relaxase